MARLLMVEDDESIGELLSGGLRVQGHEVTWSRTGKDALRRLTITPADLVLLDLGLPDLDGIEVCRQIRRTQPNCVVVILTVRNDEMDVVVSLEAGADDYLTKPFRYRELLARVCAHLRRGGPAASAAGCDEPDRTYTVGDLVVDIAARKCLLSGQDVSLRVKEFDLLARFAAAPDVALSRQTLISDVWDEHWFGSTKTLDVHVAALRRKLTNTAGDPVSAGRIPKIATLRGYGYRLETFVG